MHIFALSIASLHLLICYSMYYQLKKLALSLSVAVLFAALPATLRSAQVASLSSFSHIGKGDPFLTVSQTSSSSVSLDWNWGGMITPASYTITVTDLTTSTVLKSVTTSNMYYNVTGLTAGHTYKFTVQADNIIIMDTTMV